MIPAGYYELPVHKLQVYKHLQPEHKYYCTCSSSVVKLGKIQCINGTYQYKYYCNECGGRSKGSLPHQYVSALDLVQIPVLNRLDLPSCERCDSDDGVELHHWAPKHLFGSVEADSWPKSWLCKICHSRWHSVVTPRMSRVFDNSSRQG